MVIAEIGPKLSIKPLENLQKPIAFGKDVFNSGRLSHASIRESIDILDNFESVLESYGVKRVQAIATSAVREAANRDNFLDQVFVRTGIDVEVVEGAEENRLDLIAVENALQGRFDFDKKNCLIMEVGTGSTEIILTNKGEVSLTRTLLIGPLRLPDQSIRGQNGPGRYSARAQTQDPRCVPREFEFANTTCRRSIRLSRWALRCGSYAASFTKRRTKRWPR